VSSKLDLCRGERDVLRSCVNANVLVFCDLFGSESGFEKNRSKFCFVVVLLKKSPSSCLFSLAFRR